MSQNINQIYIANPITTNSSTDLMYFGQSPYGAGDDAAMTFANFNAQIVANGTANQIGYYATTGNKISPLGAVINGVLITNNTGVPSLLANGTAGFVLTANTAAPPSWQSLSTLGVTSITGTSNQVLVNGTVATPQTGAVTLTLPQNIATTSTPQFAGAYFGSPTGPQATTAGTIQAVGLGGLNGSATLASYYNGGAGSAPTLWTYKSRSATVGAFATVQTADELGRWEAYADDGTQFSRAGDIVIQAEGTISTGIVPGVWTFRTTNAAGAITFAMSINSSQLVTVASLFSNTTIQASSGLTSGQVAGGTAGSVTLYSPTTLLGNTQFIAENNAGNYSNILTNASTAAARTWTLPDATGTVLVTGSAINSVPSITFSSTSGIIGTTTNDSAAAGSVGEFIDSAVLIGSALSLTTNTPANVTSIVLTPGDWDIGGNIAFTGDVTTVCTSVTGLLHTSSATLLDAAFMSQTSFPAGTTAFATENTGMALMGQRISVATATTTTVYLIARASFTVSTCSACGYVWARRRR